MEADNETRRVKILIMSIYRFARRNFNFEFMSDLFPTTKTLSPRLAWIKKRDVRTLNTGGDIDGDNPWVAWIGDAMPPEGCYGEGDTEHDAITHLAKRQGWPLWNEEQFAKRNL